MSSEPDPVLLELERIDEAVRARRPQPLHEGNPDDLPRTERPSDPFGPGALMEPEVEQSHTFLAAPPIDLDRTVRALDSITSRLEGLGLRLEASEASIARPNRGTGDGTTGSLAEPGGSSSVDAARTAEVVAVSHPYGPSRSESPPVPPAPVYAAYTVRRYNETIDALKDRHAGLVIVSLLLSALIAILLVEIVLRSPATSPPVWIAVLPLVWVVPLPFFLLSFRGTHRVLDRNHLNLPETK